MKKFFFLLLLLLLPLCGAQAEEVVIVEASDMHYLSHTLVTGEEYFMQIIEQSDGKMTHYSPEICQAFVDEMLTLRPNAVILSGDLTLNGAMESHLEFAELLRPLQEAGVAVLALPGNHDPMGYAYAFTPEGPVTISGMRQEQFVEVYHPYGWDGARSRDTVSYSYMYELTPELWILLIDVNANTTHDIVRASTLAWAEQQLQEAQAAGAQVISVTHQNLLEHQKLFTSGYQIINANKLIELYTRYGVRLNLSGHMHMQHVARQEGITDIATEALAVDPCKYGVIRIADGALRYDTQVLDVAAWAEKTGVTDENLLHFAEYAADFFYQLNIRKMRRNIAEEVDADTLEAMLAYATGVNAAYFYGTLDITNEDPGLALWRQYAPDAFFTRYMQLMLAEPMEDMNHVVIPWP